jgi:signal peptidase II
MANARSAARISKRLDSQRFPTPDFVSSVSPKKRRINLAADSRHQLLIPAIFLSSIALVDQLSKLWLVPHLSDGQIHRLLGDFFRLKLVHNQGGALGTDLGGGLFYLVTSIIIILVVFYLIFIYRRVRAVVYPLSAIAGGAVGNIIDRLRLGEVVDFFDLDFFDISLFGYQIERWWTFNVADAFITLGEVALLVYLIRHTPKITPKRAKEDRLQRDAKQQQKELSDDQ